ncbi:MAG: prepilin-type N-terminal cleavage/methylation domain-containing protein [Acidobacteria bacterium]|nr:prepilin-type N-terminal cleavage/methylation domain-containing protein [Acidobacteriota bacterium]
MSLESPRKRRGLGFTLMELLVVMTVIALLASVGIVGYRHSLKVSKEAVLKENLFLLNHALEQFKADRGRYPTTIVQLREKHYLREIPVDPFTKSRETWRAEMESGDGEGADAEPGIIRIRSGSDEQSEDGIPYSEW